MRRVVAVVLVLLAFGSWTWAQEALPDDSVEKVDSFPRLKAPTRGAAGRDASRALIAACAAGLIWLDEHGFPGLAPAGDDHSSASAVMEALFRSGGETTRMAPWLGGIESYCKGHGYDVAIDYRGWVDGGKYQSGSRPDLPWILEGVNHDSTVVLMMGLYEYDPDKDLYTYIASDYLAVIGYQGANDAHPRLLTYDPLHAERRQVRAVTTLESGTFAAVAGIEAAPAAGWLSLEPAGDGRDGCIIVIDQALRFQVQKRKEAPAEGEQGESPQ